LARSAPARKRLIARGEVAVQPGGRQPLGEQAEHLVQDHGFEEVTEASAPVAR
jgi:hypothetical protein